MAPKINPLYWTWGLMKHGGILKDTKTCWDVQNFILVTAYQAPRLSELYNYYSNKIVIPYLNLDILFGGTGGRSESEPDLDSNITNLLMVHSDIFLSLSFCCLLFSNLTNVIDFELKIVYILQWHHQCNLVFVVVWQTTAGWRNAPA